MHILTWRTAQSRLLAVSATMLIAVALTWRVGLTPRMPAYLWIAVIAVPLTISDLTERRLPNRIILPSFPILLALLSLAAIVERDAASLVRALLGMLVTLTLYGIPCLLAPQAIGGGDLKLATLLSLVLASMSWQALLAAALATWVSAIGVMLLLCVIQRKSDDFPLGPILLGCAALSLLVSPFAS